MTNVNKEFGVEPLHVQFERELSGVARLKGISPGTTCDNRFA
jgi:hypothetical protein